MTLRGATPQKLGFRMPAEWEPHRATWLSWPKDPLTFPPGVLEKVEAVYVEMVRALAAGELVEILVNDPKARRRAAAALGDLANVRFHLIKTADVWTRDYCPLFVKGEGVAAVKWRFNAWGEKYEELMPDDLAGLEVARAAGERVFRPSMVLEGGSVDVNGVGDCLTTEQCLLNSNRNPNLSRGSIAQALAEFLGASRIIWLKRGIVGDDTDGHVDDIARFVDEGTAVCMVEDDRDDPNFAPLEENRRILEGARVAGGRPLRLRTLSMPEKAVGGRERLPASYANFYVGNAAVLVPQFDDPNDDAALSLFRSLFPDRRAIGLNCEALVYGFGGLHCVTQQEPA